MKTARWYFLRWSLGWAALIDGTCRIVTLGFWCPDLSLRAEGAFLDESAIQPRDPKAMRRWLSSLPK